MHINSSDLTEMDLSEEEEIEYFENDPQKLVIHKFAEMDGLYGGLLQKAVNCAKEKIASPGEYTLRKAILVKLFRIGRMKLEMLKETPLERLLTENIINTWAQDSQVQNILRKLDFIDGLDGKIDGKVGGCCIIC